MKDIQGRLRVRVAVFACVAAVALGIDQLTKMWAQQALGDGRTVPLIPGLLSLTLVHNPGASLGLGSGSTWLISLLAVVACVVMAVLAARTISMRWTVMFAFAFAGAFGNLIDRVAYADGFLNGKVVDFLNYGWSVGNVADIYLVMAGIGVVVLIVLDVPFSRKDLDRIEHLGEDAGDVARDGESDGTADESQDSSAMVQDASSGSSRTEVTVSSRQPDDSERSASSSRLVPAPDALVGSRFDVAVSQDAGHLACQRRRILSNPAKPACWIVRSPSWARCCMGRPSNSTSPKNGMSRNRCVSTWPSRMRMTMSSWSTSPWASLHMLQPDGEAPPYWAACSNAACASPHTELPGGRASCRGWMWARPA